MTKVRLLVLNTGYAENASLACMTLYHRAGFSSVEEALEDLARVFIKAAQQCRDTERRIASYEKCETHLQDFDAEKDKCSGCKKNFTYLVKLDEDSLSQLFEEFFSGTMDTANEFIEELWELDDWVPWLCRDESSEEDFIEAFKHRVHIEIAEAVVAYFAAKQLVVEAKRVATKEPPFDWDGPLWWKWHTDNPSKSVTITKLE